MGKNFSGCSIANEVKQATNVPLLLRQVKQAYSVKYQYIAIFYCRFNGFRSKCYLSNHLLSKDAYHAKAQHKVSLYPTYHKTEYEVADGLTKCPGVGDLESLRAAVPGTSRSGHFICRYCRRQRRTSPTIINTCTRFSTCHCITKNTSIILKSASYGYSDVVECLSWLNKSCQNQIFPPLTDRSKVKFSN